MSAQKLQQVVIILLIVSVALLGYMQYGAMQREAKIYETVEILQLHVESLDGLNHIQQLQIDSLKKQSFAAIVDETSASVSDGLGKFIDSVQAQLNELRNELADES